ncbi:GNAT family N-acetyltransferase [Cucumibacter marinus]|uniref:GNAT family N-acetyltransferase n=1 Tax=Cucumibacter marinus TaxID=1121252 RepID=UPI00041517B8|nr:GNAT family N-acetyltransferase [Cucumibacter marinus]
MNFAIRRLTRADGAALRALRLKALADAPEAFAEALDDAERLSATEWQTRAESECIYGLFDGETLAGMAQIDRYQSAATRHKAWLTAVYLDGSLRGQGAGRSLLAHTIEDSRKRGILQLHLGVGEYNHAVRSLYESLGFEVYGLEPRGLFAGGRYVDEHLMVLHLDKEAAS